MFKVAELKQLPDFLLEEFKLVFVTREEFNARFAEQDQKFSQLQTSVDGLTKTILIDRHEIPALGHRVDNVENWIKKAAPKSGIKYKP